MKLGTAELDPCPKCGGMTVLVYTSKSNWPSVWCTECETLWEPSERADDIVREWWNRGQEA